MDHRPAAGISYFWGCPMQRDVSFTSYSTGMENSLLGPADLQGFCGTVSLWSFLPPSTAKRRCCPPISSTVCTRSSSVVGTGNLLRNTLINPYNLTRGRAGRQGARRKSKRGKSTNLNVSVSISVAHVPNSPHPCNNCGSACLK